MDSLIFPEEFHFMGVTEYSELCDLVDGWLSAHAMPERVDRQDGIINIRSTRVGILNVFQKCHALPPADWPAELDAYLSLVVSESDHQFNARLMAFPDLTFDEAKEGIKIRIKHRDYVPDANSRLVTFPICDEFLTVVELDTPQATITVDQSFLTRWSKAAEELWYLGLDNIWKQDYVEPEAQDIEGLGTMFAISSDSFFTTSHLLMLGKHFPGTDHRGFLVAIPNRHILLCKEISAIQDLNILPRLLFGTQKMYEEGPGSISAKLFWWHDQRIEAIRIEASNREFHFAPSPELKLAMNL